MVATFRLVKRIALEAVVAVADVLHHALRLVLFAVPREKRRDNILKASHCLAVVRERRLRNVLLVVPRHP